MEKKNVQRKQQSGQVNSSLLEKQPAQRRGGEIRKSPADTSKPLVLLSPEDPKLHSEERQRDLGPKDPGGSKRHHQKNVSRRAEYSKAISKKTEAIPGGEEIYIRDKSVGEDEEWEGESEKESG